MSEAPETEVLEETALYRVYGEADLLLYIGISNDFGRRWKQHAKRQPWWAEMRRLAVDEWFDSRPEAEEAETAAIKAEKPKYNKQHAVPPPRRPATAGPPTERRTMAPRVVWTPAILEEMGMPEVGAAMMHTALERRRRRASIARSAA